MQSVGLPPFGVAGLARAGRTLGLSLAVLLGLGAPAGPAAGQIDRDQNGLGDVWEASYGRGRNASADRDGDGRTDGSEERAGTHPDVPASALVITSLDRPSPGVLRVVWPSVLGKDYRLEAATDFGTWRPLAGTHAGTGALLSANLPVDSTFLDGPPQLARWTGLAGGTGLTQLVAWARAGTPAPATSFSVPTFEIAQTSPDLSNIGHWVRGWIIAPSTGSYTFWLASDDHGELWLSTGSTAGAVRRIASVPGWTSWREFNKYPEQQSSPVDLVAGRAYYLEAFQREWGGGDHLSVAWRLPGSAAPPTVIGPPHVTSDGRSLASLLSTGGLQLRVSVADRDSDGDGVTDYEEGMVGLNPLAATTTPRVADRDALLALLDAPSTITIGAVERRAYENDGTRGRLTLFRSGGIEPLTVNLAVTGTALPGLDYRPLASTVTFGPAQRSVDVWVEPWVDAVVEGGETVTAQIQAGSGYLVGTPASASVTIDDAADLLHVAQIRPVAGRRSPAKASAVLRQAGNSVFADLRLEGGNLAAPQVAAELYVTGAGTVRPVVLRLPPGPIATHRWDFAAAGGLTRDQILAALASGRLGVRLTTAAAPDGEAEGLFTRQAGWQTAPTPPVPPAAPAAPADDAEAARFLTQATYGPTAATIARVRQLGYAAWLDEQFALPPTRHLDYVNARRAELLARSSGQDDGWQSTRQEAFWQATLTAPDQLRQRVAFALSQILVVSQIGALEGEHVGTTLYQDLLLEEAFGNFRTLLERVTLSPMMGTYLSMIRNQRPNPLTGAEPDENYAREIMQLFALGLKRLHPDGSLQLDAAGWPIDTYTQADIVGLAHVFTGWGPHYDVGNPPRWDDGRIATPDEWFLWGWDALRPMSYNANFADLQARTIVGGLTVPAGLTGPERLRRALDHLFQHPNVGPFLARQLIQRLVTSNPSPGYVSRVAAVFANNGAGVRGDLRAVVRAILLDWEARSPETAGWVGFGQIREPVRRVAHLLRSLEAAPPLAGDSRYFLNFQYSMSQNPLLSPSVFNFFEPGYAPPGPLAAAGLVAPEMQITSETTTIGLSNLVFEAAWWGIWTRESNQPGGYYPVRLPLAAEVAVLSRPGFSDSQNDAALLDRLNTLLLAGRMSSTGPQGGLRGRITAAWARLPSWFGRTPDRLRDRAAMAVYLILTSPEYAAQR